MAGLNLQKIFQRTAGFRALRTRSAACCEDYRLTSGSAQEEKFFRSQNCFAARWGAHFLLLRQRVRQSVQLFGRVFAGDDQPEIAVLWSAEVIDVRSVNAGGEQRSF